LGKFITIRRKKVRNKSVKTVVRKHLKMALIFTGVALVSQVAIAGGSMTLGDMASGITATFEKLGNLITGGSYLAGLGFAIAAILKFKAHKDNPTQITVGTPIALVFIAAALLFLPSILSVTGSTMFGASPTTAGPKGTTIS
jgi:intracellular multiplication protein IcmD